MLLSHFCEGALQSLATISKFLQLLPLRMLVPSPDDRKKARYEQCKTPGHVEGQGQECEQSCDAHESTEQLRDRSHLLTLAQRHAFFKM